MKKKILSILLILIFTVMLTGCSLDFSRTSTLTTIDANSAVDRKSIADDIYDRVKDQVEADLYTEIYNQLLEEFGDATITWETLQREVYSVVDGAAKSNVSVTNYKTNTNGEISASSYGSGVIYERENLTGDGYKYRYYVITNQHVVSGGLRFGVGFEDETSIDAILVAADETTDIAVLYFDTDREFTIAELGSSSDLKTGTFVLAIGNPKGSTLFGSVTFGVISGNNRNLIDGDSVNTFLFYIQHDAAINSGNSGGGLFTLDGKVIGINSVKYASSDIEGLNFSIPIDLVKEVVSQLRETGYYDGTVSFGITCTAVSGLLNAGRVEYNVPDNITEGLLVISVAEGSSSDGVLAANDIIIKANGADVKDSSDLQPILKSSRIGDSVELVIVRGGEEQTVTVTFKRKQK